MNSLREFLESSTIHGLSYISTAPSKASKALWLAIVVTGFCTAGYLINSSYKEWQSAPISTAISTHPISDLDFPTITVCPPERSNTILNYDLMRAANMTLTDQNRQTLVNLSRDLLIHAPALKFAKQALAMINENNVPNLFGKVSEQTYPFPYIDDIIDKPGFEIWSSALNGDYTSPGFAQPIDCNLTYPNVRFTLLLPLDKRDLTNETFELSVLVESNKEVGMKFRKGSKFVYVHSAEKWVDAEKMCRGKGGHLASVRHFKDHQKVSVSDEKAWLGGTDEDVEDEWLWPDGSPVPNKSVVNCGNGLTEEERNTNVPCQSWNIQHPRGGDAINCLSFLGNEWFSSRCNEFHPFWCEYQSFDLSESSNTTFELARTKFSQLEFWWQPNSKLSQKDCSTDKKMPGFSLKWKTSRGLKNEITKQVSHEHSKDYKYIKDILNYVKWQVTGMVSKAKGHNMTNEQVWEKLTLCKERLLTSNILICDSGYPKKTIIGKVVRDLIQEVSGSLSKTKYIMTKEDYVFTLDIFSYLLFCNKEANNIYLFYNNLFKTGNVKSILQATVNNLQSKDINKEAKESLMELYRKLDDIVNFKIGSISQVFSGDSLNKMVENREKYIPTRNISNKGRLGEFKGLCIEISC